MGAKKRAGKGRKSAGRSSRGAKGVGKAVAKLSREDQWQLVRSLLQNLESSAANDVAPAAAKRGAKGRPAAVSGARGGAAAFLAKKKPRTHVERLVCLAHYLTHEERRPAFQTRDLSDANKAAGQEPFSNAALAAKVARDRGYLKKASGGQVKIGPAGEKLVKSLPG